MQTHANVCKCATLLTTFSIWMWPLRRGQKAVGSKSWILSSSPCGLRGWLEKHLRAAGHLSPPPPNPAVAAVWGAASCATNICCFDSAGSDLDKVGSVFPVPFLIPSPTCEVVTRWSRPIPGGSQGPKDRGSPHIPEAQPPAGKQEGRARFASRSRPEAQI